MYVVKALELLSLRSFLWELLVVQILVELLEFQILLDFPVYIEKE
jgi:hypothetical protein